MKIGISGISAQPKKLAAAWRRKRKQASGENGIMAKAAINLSIEEEMKMKMKIENVMKEKWRHQASAAAKRKSSAISENVT
jgi:hypothetical protein